MLTCAEYAELTRFRLKPVSEPDGPTPMIENLQNKGYIQATRYKSSPNFSRVPVEWKITGAGEAALSEFEEERQKEAKNERQRRFQNKISVLNMLVPLVTFFLGLVVEHFAGLLDFLASLFHV